MFISRDNAWYYPICSIYDFLEIVSFGNKVWFCVECRKIMPVSWVINIYALNPWHIYKFTINHVKWKSIFVWSGLWIFFVRTQIARLSLSWQRAHESMHSVICMFKRRVLFRHIHVQKEKMIVQNIFVLSIKHVWIYLLQIRPESSLIWIINWTKIEIQFEL